MRHAYFLRHTFLQHLFPQRLSYLPALSLLLSVSLMLSQGIASAETPHLFGKTTAKATEKAKPAETPTPTLSDEQLSKMNPELKAQIQKLSDAMQQEARSINNDLQDVQDESTKDIAMLWQAAVERSASIRFAIEKLSRTDETGKPVHGDSVGKRILQSATRLGGVAGSMLTGNPAGMLGSNMVENLLLSDPSNSALQRVTDADMVILAKEVEVLQSRVIELYYTYRQTEERWKLSQEALQTLNKYYGKASDIANDSMDTILNSLYESAKQDESEARQAYVSARNELGLLVGPDALKAVETAHQMEAKTAGTAASN